MARLTRVGANKRGAVGRRSGGRVPREKSGRARIADPALRGVVGPVRLAGVASAGRGTRGGTRSATGAAAANTNDATRRAIGADQGTGNDTWAGEAEGTGAATEEGAVAVTEMQCIIATVIGRENGTGIETMNASGRRRGTGSQSEEGSVGGREEQTRDQHPGHRPCRPGLQSRGKENCRHNFLTLRPSADSRRVRRRWCLDGCARPSTAN